MNYTMAISVICVKKTSFLLSVFWHSFNPLKTRKSWKSCHFCTRKSAQLASKTKELKTYIPLYSGIKITFLFVFCFSFFLVDSIEHRHKEFMSVLLLITSKIFWKPPPTESRNRGSNVSVQAKNQSYLELQSPKPYLNKYSTQRKRWKL